MMWYFYIIAFLRTISFSVQTRIKINDISLNFNFHGFLDTTAWGHRLIIDFGTKRNMVQFRQKLGDAVWLTSVTPSIAFSHKFLENSWYSKFAFWPPNFFPKNDWKPIWIIGSSENHRNFEFWVKLSKARQGRFSELWLQGPRACDALIRR